MKYPWMPLFWGDFLANTMHLSAQEAGAYLFLIAHLWEHNGLVETDFGHLRRVARVRADHWAKVWTALEPFFVVEQSGSLYKVSHDRVQLELLNAAKLSNKRKDAALQMHSKRNASASGLHMHPHSQSPKQSYLGEGSAGARSRAGAPNGARAPSPAAETAATPPAPNGGRQGMSPDVGDDYRSPPRQKSENELHELPDQPSSGPKQWRRHTDEELRAIYAAKHEPDDQT